MFAEGFVLKGFQTTVTHVYTDVSPCLETLINESALPVPMLRQVSKVAIPFDTGVDFEKISFSKVGPSKNRSWGPFGSSFWRLLGTLLEPLGTLLAPCGALWEPLGSIFGSVGRLVAHLSAF